MWWGGRVTGEILSLVLYWSIGQRDFITSTLNNACCLRFCYCIPKLACIQTYGYLDINYSV